MPKPSVAIVKSAAAAAALALVAVSARATDIRGIMPAALDQPQINAVIRMPVPTGSPLNDPLYADFFGSRAFNVTAFLDTGASGVLLSNNTAGFLGDLYNPGVPTATYTNGKTIVYQDVGVAGSDNFRVSVPVQISVGAFNDTNAQNVADAEEAFSNSDPPSFQGIDLSYYRHTTGAIRTQVGPLDTSNPNDPADNPLLGDLDVFGMPVMKGKVVVMDPKGVDNFVNGDINNGYQMKTHLYNPGTAFNASTPDDPGIPKTNRTVKLSYGSFDQFTQTGTLETDGSVTPLPANQVANYQPTLEHNPFIGPNPINPTGDNTPPIKIGFSGQTASGSFLLDTGSAASMISTAMADKLHVRYVPGTQGTDDPHLEIYDPAHPQNAGTLIDSQFQLSIGGIGGTTKVAGFFLDSMLLRTMEGALANDNDPKHFRFLEAPVLVSDISVKTPDGSRTLTLDGIFGMNNLVASLFVDEAGGGGGFPAFGALTPGAFDWVVFDETTGQLKLRPRLMGDANRDGVVDFSDLVAMAQNYNGEVTLDQWANGDFNADGVVDFNDLVFLAQHYNDPNAIDSLLDLPHYDFDLGFGQPVPGASVPEPSTAALLAACGFAPLLRRRARRV